MCGRRRRRPRRARRARRRKPRCARCSPMPATIRRAKALLDTPKRVVDAYEEIFQGYSECPADVLDRTFSETAGYDDFVLVKDIGFNSHCEHHMMPFFGKAHVAYMPTDRVVGLSKLARLVDVYARAPADAGAPDLADRDRDRRDPQAARRRGDDRSRAHVHVDARRDQARRADGDHAFHRRVPRRSRSEQVRFMTMVRDAQRLVIAVIGVAFSASSLPGLIRQSMMPCDTGHAGRDRDSICGNCA